MNLNYDSCFRVQYNSTYTTFTPKIKGNSRCIFSYFPVSEYTLSQLPCTFFTI